MVLREASDGKIRGTYNHDEGTLVGKFNENGVLEAWWCEAPSREPSGDAGDAEFEFTEENGTMKIDGRWRNGSSGEWKDDWNLERNQGMPPDILKARFEDESKFCGLPDG